MENRTENKTMTFEEALQDPSLAHVHEGLRYLQKTPPEAHFPKKYEKSMINLAIEDTVNLLQKGETLLNEPNLKETIKKNTQHRYSDRRPARTARGRRKRTGSGA